MKNNNKTKVKEQRMILFIVVALPVLIAMFSFKNIFYSLTSSIKLDILRKEVNVLNTVLDNDVLVVNNDIEKFMSQAGYLDNVSKEDSTFIENTINKEAYESNKYELALIYDKKGELQASFSKSDVKIDELKDSKLLKKAYKTSRDKNISSGIMKLGNKLYISSCITLFGDKDDVQGVVVLGSELSTSGSDKLFSALGYSYLGKGDTFVVTSGRKLSEDDEEYKETMEKEETKSEENFIGMYIENLLDNSYITLKVTNPLNNKIESQNIPVTLGVVFASSVVAWLVGSRVLFKANKK